jgi:glycosyltransferase involved in cell wall biosynthesis
MTDPLGQSQVLPYIIGLSALGHEFHLISFEKKGRFEEERKKIENLCNQSDIYWHPLSYTKKPPLLSTIYDVRRMSAKAKSLQIKNNFDIVHCRSYISGLIGLSMKRKYQTKFLFDMRGFWADERIEGGIWNSNNPVLKRVYNFFKRKEREFFNNSDHIISLTSAGKKEILKMQPTIAESKITVIPCCVDLEKFNPDNYSKDQIDSIKQELNIPLNDMVLGYVGSIGTWYMLDEMLDFYIVFREKYTSSKFLFITAENPNYILERAESKGISEESIIIKKSPHNSVPSYMLTFDYSIFFIKPTFSKSASSPTKQAELMAMGIPIICNSGVGDTDAIVIEHCAGSVIPNFDSLTYKQLLDQGIQFDKSMASNAALNEFSLREGVVRYQKVYESLTFNG